jgi:cobalt/nickel transport system ATP-binding protein
VSHHIVQAQDVHYSYSDGTRAVCGVSFTITHGEAVAIVGANGAGKSTLLQHLNGCLMPTSGAIRIGDTVLARRTIPIIRRTVGMVFQDPDDQLFMPTVFDDVAFGPVNLGLPADQVRARVAEALETVGMSLVAHRPPYRLSGGEKRAVSIATVLAMSPDILVMDEPSSNLDPRARRRLIELLRTFIHTKIIATHDLDLAMDVCGRTIVLHQGRVAADGPTGEILRDESILGPCGLEKPLSLQGCPVCSAAAGRAGH